MKPFVVNRHGRLVFPANFLGDLDFSVLDTLDQFTAVIGRDFEAKAPTGTDILSRVESEAYPRRFELLRDLGQNLYWANRYSITMFDRRPTRWRDLAKRRDDVYLPVLTPWEDSERKVAAVEQAFRALPPTWDAEAEDTIFDLLFGLFRTKLYHATELPPIKPTVAEFLAQPDALTFVMPEYDPDYPVFTTEQILDANEDVPELEALMRWAMVLHNQYPWDRSGTELRGPGEIGDDDFVVAFHPRNRDVHGVHRAGEAPAPGRGAGYSDPGLGDSVEPVTPYPPVRVREAFAVQPRFEALAIVRGEHVCTNADVIRNASFSWSPMSADEIAAKTGIEQRCYTSREPEQLALHAARAALAKSGRSPAEIGAVLVSTCTSNRLIPSIACWLSGELGLLQTHASVDMVAACAGSAVRDERGRPPAPGGQAAGPAGLRGEVLRQDRHRPHLADDLRRRGGGDGHRAGRRRRDRGRGGAADLRERAAQRGQLDHLAELGVRRRHHRVRSGGEGAGPAVPDADARRARRGSRTRTRRGGRCSRASS